MLVEMIFLGRGGQGGVTASNILVQAAIYDSKYGQSFPFFGAERRGAPVTAYARISDRPILKHGMFSEADVLVVLDESLLELGVAKRYTIRDGGFLVVNTARSDVSKDYLSLRGRASVYAVNATKVAKELGLVIAGWPLVNTPMLGALVAATGVVSLGSVEKAIIDYFGEKTGGRNVEAVKKAYSETTRIGEV
ncbi:MAG: 2-oxoacid:acceptor oxidoreductase family protein [Desulfurococcaceae archaeon]|nr:2-oxoacid:acceptor oxidoreductase family protein [Desulfurococcaceae archaeon]MCC6054736.1 2-oxoacid:acceptor oxidoreductase family protein [Thermosphaera sp.]